MQRKNGNIFIIRLKYLSMSGYEYQNIVSKSKIENPPADASSLKYNLLKVVSKKLATMK